MMELVHEAYDGSPRLRSEYFKLATATAGATGSAEGDLTFTRARQQRRQHRRLDPRAGRGRRPHAGVRLPHGHLLLLRLPQDRGHRPQRPDRRGVRRCPTRTSSICVSAPVGDVAVDL